MSLFTFFFPHGHHSCRENARERAAARRRSRRARARIRELEQERFSQIENDVGFIALVLESLMQKLDEKGSVTRAEVQDLVHELDLSDGVLDGKIDIAVLRQVGEIGSGDESGAD